MSPQHDYIIDNSTGANVRSDINSVLQAIASNNSGSSAPSTTYAFQLFADTTNNVMKIRNAANNAFIELFQLDGTLTMEDGSAANPAIAFRNDLDCGLFRPEANAIAISSGGKARLIFNTEQTIFNESGDDFDFRIESDTNTHMFFVDAGNNRVGIGTSTPATALDLQGDLTITSTAPFINFIDSDNNDDFNIQVSGGLFSFNSTTDSATRMQIGSDGEVYFGTTNWPTGSMGKAAGRVLIGNGGDLTLWNETNSAGGGASFKLATKEGGDATKIGFCQMFGGTVNTSDQTGFLNIKISDASGGGNTKVRIDGDGLKFNSDTAADTALDEYEQGTFTATNTIGITLTENFPSRYVKVGNLCYIMMDVSFSGAADTSQCGIIQSLPFTSENLTNGEQYVTYPFISETSSNNRDEDLANTVTFIGKNESRVDIFNFGLGAIQSRAFLSGRRMRFNFCYRTA